MRSDLTPIRLGCITADIQRNPDIGSEAKVSNLNGNFDYIMLT